MIHSDAWKHDVNHVCRDLILLSSTFVVVAKKILSTCMVEGVPVLLFETYRTPARQAFLSDHGHSRVSASAAKHPKGEAIDLILDVHAIAVRMRAGALDAWDDESPDAVKAWLRVREIARECGAKSGAEFKPIRSLTGLGWDPGHIESITDAPWYVAPTL